MQASMRTACPPQRCLWSRRRRPVAHGCQRKRIQSRQGRPRRLGATEKESPEKQLRESNNDETAESHSLLTTLSGEKDKILTGSVEEETEERPVKYSGLRGNPLSCGVNSATQSYKLSSPAIAARNLVEQVQCAHLCTVMSNKHHRRAGYPFGTLVDFVGDGSGFPVIRLSSLAVPTRNVIEDPRSSIMLQMPGWAGLTNTRVTIFGDIYQLPPHMEDAAKQLFLKQSSSEMNLLTGNLQYFRMHDIKDIFFVGGFGTVQWIDVNEYIHAQPDPVVVACTSTELQKLNSKFSDNLRRVLSRKHPVHEAELISIDALGADVRTRTGGDYGVVRINFSQSVASIDEVNAAFGEIISSFNVQRKRRT